MMEPDDDPIYKEGVSRIIKSIASNFNDQAYGSNITPELKKALTDQYISTLDVIGRNFYSNTGVIHHLIGVKIFKTGDFEKALPYFERALRNKPNFAEFHSQIGIVYTKLGQHDKAITHHLKALEIQPNNTDFKDCIGCAYNKAGQYNKALPYNLEAVELYPHRVEFQNNLACAYIGLGRYEEADYHLKTAIECDSAYPYPYKNLAKRYLVTGNLDKAREYATIALEKAGLEHDEIALRMINEVLSDLDDPTKYQNYGVEWADLTPT